MSSPPSSRPWLLPSVEIVTVGLPFCAFKVLTGLVLVHTAALRPFGVALVALGVIDLGINLTNLFALLVAHRRLTGVCLADVVLRWLGRNGPHADLGLAIDVFMSFVLVAVVIGAGLLAHLPRWALVSWNVAVVVNVLGAGLGRLVAALRR